jgi:RHS repeat-associated protein
VNLSTGAATYLVSDSLGSVRGTVNGSGSLTGSTSYDAWGNPSTTGGLTATTPFGYAGYYIDSTGLDYLLNRYYDPSTGQFTSLDPLVGQTLLPYEYTPGDPVSDVDPTGMDSGGPETQPVHGRAPAPGQNIPDSPGPTLFLWLHRVHDIAVASAAFNLAFVYHSKYGLGGKDLVKAFQAEHYIPGVSKTGKEKYGRADLTFSIKGLTDVWEVKSESYEVKFIQNEVYAYCRGSRIKWPHTVCHAGFNLYPTEEYFPTPLGRIKVYTPPQCLNPLHYEVRCGAIQYTKLSFRKIKWNTRPRSVPVRVMVEKEVVDVAKEIAGLIAAGALGAIIAQLLKEWLVEAIGG